MKLFSALLLGFVSAASAISLGDRVPSIDLDLGFPPERVNLASRTAGKKTILVGLPGAFTPTWSSVQVPGYLEAQSKLKMRGIDEVLVYCVNDGAVMKAWAENQEVEGSMLTFLGDPSRALTDALDMVLDHPGPMGVLGYKRCKRFALYIDDGVVKVVRVSESPGDPAGDEDPSATLADAMLDAIDNLKDEL